MTAQSIASSVARSVSQSVAGIGSGGYDAAAQDYFTRAEALGGDFDRTAINAAYTPAHVKAAINAFVAGCKTDLIWTKLTEVYLMAGVSFGGLMAKLKYSSVATLTNTNFVSGDFVGAGSGAGLKGNASNKYIACNVAPASIATVASCNIGLYVTQAGVTTNKALFESATGWSYTEIFGIDNTGTSSKWKGYAGPTTSANAVSSSSAAGLVTLSSITATDLQMYQNGVSSGSYATTRGGNLTATPLALFGVNNGSISSHSDSRLTFAHVGTGLTATDALNLSLRVNALMTALGAKVY